MYIFHGRSTSLVKIHKPGSARSKGDPSHSTENRRSDQTGALPEIDLCQVQPFLQIVMVDTAGKMIITKALSRSQDKITKKGWIGVQSNCDILQNIKIQLDSFWSF